ncbi:hypothetical protein JL720_12302 [Aureococcus anophagefferens]|nr:hypothetical protein JL720_12302 [Aureococcus anophagefferens]
MAKTGKQELGIAVSGAWAATLLDRWASLLGGERENNVARLVVGDVRVTAWDVSRSGARCRSSSSASADYYPSPPPPGVGGETGAFDAGARAMLEGLLKRRFAALPDLLRVCIPPARLTLAAAAASPPSTRRRYSEFKALAAALKRAARTPPLPGSRRSLESVLSRVGFPDTLPRQAPRRHARARAVVALSAGFDDAGARAAVVDFVDPAGHLHMVLARPTRTNRLRALESLLSPPPPDPPAPPEDAHRRPPPAPDAGPDVVDSAARRRWAGRRRARRACGGRAGAGAEPAVRWRESAPAFGETAAVVMPEPVDRFDELAAATSRGAPLDLAELAPAHRLTVAGHLGVAAALRAAATDGGGVDGRSPATPPWGRGSTRSAAASRR